MTVGAPVVSVKDVAALAGVSVGTVSNVLNSPNKVSEKTRLRVSDAIMKLGWVRNESARQLGAGRSRNVGMVVMDISNPFFTDVLRGAEDFITTLGLSVHIGNSALDHTREAAHLKEFEQDRVRGILVAPVENFSDRSGQLRRRGIPVVVLDRVEENSDFCTVSVDDVEGGRLAVEHLIRLGHRRLAVVGGPGSHHQVRDRRLGAELALTSAVDREMTLLTVSTPALDVVSGAEAARQLVMLPEHERPSGVFAVNDLVAIGLLQGFVTLNLSVPADFAIIGYDDVAFAAAAAVPLSSIRQPRADLGRRAAQLLFEEIAAADTATPHQHQHVLFTPELVVRQSTIGAKSQQATRNAEHSSA